MSSPHLCHRARCLIRLESLDLTLEGIDDTLHLPKRGEDALVVFW